MTEGCFRAAGVTLVAALFKFLTLQTLRPGGSCVTPVNPHSFDWKQTSRRDLGSWQSGGDSALLVAKHPVSLCSR